MDFIWIDDTTVRGLKSKVKTGLTHVILPWSQKKTTRKKKNAAMRLLSVDGVHDSLKPA